VDVTQRTLAETDLNAITECQDCGRQWQLIAHMRPVNTGKDRSADRAAQRARAKESAA
jgi:ribosomal protein L34E